MQDYELDAWLGDTKVTDEQRAALHRASDMIDARYPDPDTREDAGMFAFNAAAMIILGDDTLPAIAKTWADARRAERDAMAALTGAIIATSADLPSEPRIAALAGVTRVTVRKALGK